MINSIQYHRLARFFKNMKAIHGPDFVNATLSRHSKLKQALLDYEKTYIIDLEGEILFGDSYHESNSNAR